MSSNTSQHATDGRNVGGKRTPRVSSEPLPTPQLLTVRDLAGLLRIHPRSVWRMATMGKIPAALCLGPKTIRWRASDINAYVAKLAGHADEEVRRD